MRKRKPSDVPMLTFGTSKKNQLTVRTARRGHIELSGSIRLTLDGLSSLASKLLWFRTQVESANLQSPVQLRLPSSTDDGDKMTSFSGPKVDRTSDPS